MVHGTDAGISDPPLVSAVERRAPVVTDRLSLQPVGEAGQLRTVHGPVIFLLGVPVLQPDPVGVVRVNEACDEE